MSVALFGVPAAQALPPVEKAVAQEHRIDHRLAHIARRHGHSVERLSSTIVSLRQELRGLNSRLFSRGRWVVAHQSLRHTIQRTRAQLRRHGKRVRHRVLQLQRVRAGIKAWLATWGTFRACPVDGPTTLANNFGVMVRIPGVPVHRHEGDDMDAAAGTPIVAPFDGFAFPTSSTLGGKEVTVSGPLGYVYNAHLSSYGTLGNVHAGDVIGYVGTTGDATGPHDHFEWHPDSGVAVDPNPLLLLVC
jgi:Peptidase family M23